MKKANLVTDLRQYVMSQCITQKALRSDHLRIWHQAAFISLQLAMSPTFDPKYMIKKLSIVLCHACPQHAAEEFEG